MQRLVIRAIIAPFLILSLSFGGWISHAAAFRQETVVLRVAMPPVTNLDPVQISRFDPHKHDLVENLFVGLTRYNPATQQAEPMIASSWTVSEDGLTWTFALRDDIEWVRYDDSAGEVVAVRPVVAGDFVYAIQRACDPLRPSPLTANLMIVRGCQTVANAFPEVVDDLFIAREISVRAPTPTTLEIDLIFPLAYVPTLVSTPEFRPLARESVGSEGNWSTAETIITNGPYALEASSAQGLTLTRNPVWPEEVAGNVDQIDVTFTGETRSTPALFSREEVDFARLESSEIETARSLNGFHSTPGSSLVMMGFSYDRTMVGQTEVRRALALALDREALANQVLGGQAVANPQFTPPGVIAAPNFNGFTFNAAQAQTDFATAGFPDCNNVAEKLIILVPEEDPIWGQLAQAVVDQWSAQLGCNPVLFEIRTLPRVLMIELSHGTYDTETVTRSHIWLAMWSADYPDASAWINDALHCRYGYIRTGRECDQGDTWLDQAALEPDPAKRAELYAQTEAHFFSSTGTFPVIPLYMTVSAWLQQPQLSNVNDSGAARYDLWTLGNQAAN